MNEKTETTETAIADALRQEAAGGRGFTRYAQRKLDAQKMIDGVAWEEPEADGDYCNDAELERLAFWYCLPRVLCVAMIAGVFGAALWVYGMWPR